MSRMITYYCQNVGLEHAKGDWIFCLDADEEVAARDAAKLRDVLTETEALIIGVQIMNYYDRLNLHDFAFRHTNEAIRKFLEKQEAPPSLLYKLKYEILVMTNSFDSAWPAIDRANTLYPNYVYLHFYKGLIFFGKGKFKEEIQVFQHCLMPGETNHHLLPLKGAGSCQA